MLKELVFDQDTGTRVVFNSPFNLTCYSKMFPPTDIKIGLNENEELIFEPPRSTVKEMYALLLFLGQHQAAIVRAFKELKLH